MTDIMFNNMVFFLLGTGIGIAITILSIRVEVNEFMHQKPRRKKY
jgi:hypothetical protein